MDGPVVPRYVPRKESSHSGLIPEPKTEIDRKSKPTNSLSSLKHSLLVELFQRLGVSGEFRPVAVNPRVWRQSDGEIEIVQNCDAAMLKRRYLPKESPDERIACFLPRIDPSALWRAWDGPGS